MEATDVTALLAAGLPVSFGKVKARRTKRKHYCKGVEPVASVPIVPQPRSTLPFPHSRVVAPMVGASDLAFRLLCRRHGADLCYTEMLSSPRFVEEEAYRRSLFFDQILVGSSLDRPLIAQFSGNDPGIIVAAAKMVEAHVDGVDVNLGCPQSKAAKEGVGAFLLDRCQ